MGSNFSSGGGASAEVIVKSTQTHVPIATNPAQDGARGGGIHGPIVDEERRSGAAFVPLRFTNTKVAQNTAEVQEGTE